MTYYKRHKAAILLVLIFFLPHISTKSKIEFREGRIEKAPKSNAKFSRLNALGKAAQDFSWALPGSKAAFQKTIPRSLVSKVENVASTVKSELDEALRQESKIPLAARKKTAFGPHLLVNSKAQEISRVGAIFEEATQTAAKGLNLGRDGASQLKDLPELHEAISCPFNKSIVCDPQAKYRTMDGSCNNLANPYWGRANTPFERFLPAAYDDGFASPRAKSVSKQPLPLARLISTEIHSKSTVADLHPAITHMTMEFGQLISHDINLNTLSTGNNGERLACCHPNGRIDDSTFLDRLGCLPIEIPVHDPYFFQHGRTCMNFVRAVDTPDLNCDLGVRQQLNQVSHYIDASTVYGSDTDTMTTLRSFSDGLLNVTDSENGPLLLQTGAPCSPASTQQCFKAGDVRAHEHPALLTLHTIFLREHNRVATQLKVHNPGWDDEKLFQEARKIVGAEIQHVTYNEYLPTILGDTFAGFFEFEPQPSGTYFTEYYVSINPSIRNSFVAAAYRFGHSTVRDHVINGQLLKDHFLKPDLLYQASVGPSNITDYLIRHSQQKTDNLITSQLTNHLFESYPGTGIDLAATNIQRGRDHGLASYNTWRVWCNLERASSFTGPTGLIDHEPAIAQLLSTVYQHPDDIDLWTGIVSENPLEGKAVGPTGACIIGRQFWILKHADRFYYETNDPHAKFEIEQLDEIRKTSLARIICDNTDLNTLSANVFEKPSNSNPAATCSRLQAMDLRKWTPCADMQWSPWSHYSPCVDGFTFRTRHCPEPPPGRCGKRCIGKATKWKRCSDIGPNNFPFGPKPMFPPRKGPPRNPKRKITK